MCIFTFAVLSSVLMAAAVSNLENNNVSGCICVPQHMCRDNDAALNGEGNLDIRYESGVCENYFEICCDNPMEVPVQQQKVKQHKGCGFRNPLGVGYRVTGSSENAQFGEFPWTTVVLYKDHTDNENRNMYKCGGSLIHQQVVLTAAHCVSGAADGQWTIRAGEWNTRSQDEPLPHQDRLVQEIVIHQHYQGGSLKNDIALLFLGEPFEAAENVGFICLPPPGTQLDDARCIASGWGKDAFKKGKHSSILKKVELPIVPRDSCQQSLRSTRLGQFYHLHRSFICAGGEQNKDTCKGDGGSPLVCPIADHPGRFVQRGIVSWGIGCGQDNTPGVYANVALYRDWVDKQLGARSFDTSLYKYE